MTEQATEVKKSHAIIRGRIPLAIVYLIRFVDHAEASKALAEKYATTVGKIDDIKKNRNFGYVTEDVRFTAEQIAEAKTYIQQHEDVDHINDVNGLLDNLPEATKEEAEAFAAVKRKNNGQDRTKEGEVINAGGGNRQKSSKKKKADEAAEGEGEAPAEGGDAEQVAEGQAPSAEELLNDI